MLFPTLNFALFFLALFLVAWSIHRHNEWRKIVLLLASWIFYGAWDWRFVPLLIASSVLNYAAAEAISRNTEPRWRQLVLCLGVAANLAILGVFKYYGFFVEQASAALHAMRLPLDPPLLQVILPVGVSFFTFQGMSYVIDVYLGRCKPARLLDVTLLLSFFAHLVAGPIVRGADLLPQFARTPTLTREMAARGMLLIVWGLFKKTVISTQLALLLVDKVFFDSSRYTPVDLVLGAWGYAVQIYCDFSAYSDMAIGLAALLGYEFKDNFNQPYRASSLQDFWRRWHISLSSWLRDYLYIPMGGSRGGLLLACRNLWITMVLGGLWHGAAWTFIVWGVLHGTWLCVERVWTAIRPTKGAVLPGWVGVVLTFHIVCLGWIFFRSPTLPAAMQYLAGLGGDWSRPPLLASPLVLGLIAVGLAIHALPARILADNAQRLARLPIPLAAGATAGMILVVDALRPSGVAPFIYFQF